MRMPMSTTIPDDHRSCSPTMRSRLFSGLGGRAAYVHDHESRDDGAHNGDYPEHRIGELVGECRSTQKRVECRICQGNGYPDDAAEDLSHGSSVGTQLRPCSDRARCWVHGGIFKATAVKARLLAPEDLDPVWDPTPLQWQSVTPRHLCSPTAPEPNRLMAAVPQVAHLLCTGHADRC